MLGNEWKKSMRSGQSGQCVEVRLADGAVEVRESDEPGVVIRTTPEKWAAFVAGAKNGEFDI